MRLLLLLALPVALGVPAAASLAAAPSRPPLGTVLERVVTAAGAPGGVLVVSDEAGRQAAATGKADLRTGAAMRVSHRFRAGAVTEAFVALAMLQSIADDNTYLDERAEAWLTGVPLGSGPRLKIRHLLNHTSGLLPRGGRVEPGTRFAHNARNYVLLGSIVEATTGSSLRFELRRRIFRPLGLRATLYPGGATVPGLARGYVRGLAVRDVTRVTDPKLAAAEGVVSTADDLARFARALLGGELLPAKLAREFKRPVRVKGFAADAYGLGIFRVRTPCGVAWGQRGTTDGYTTWTFATADGSRAVAAAVNAGSLTLGRLLPAEKLVRGALCP